jgi:hypothetical protein
MAEPAGLHLQGNGYNNAWFIKDFKGGAMVIEFWPQRLFCWGAVISGLFVIMALGYLVSKSGKSWKK